MPSFPSHQEMDSSAAALVLAEMDAKDAAELVSVMDYDDGAAHVLAVPGAVVVSICGFFGGVEKKNERCEILECEHVCFLVVLVCWKM